MLNLKVFGEISFPKMPSELRTAQEKEAKSQLEPLLQPIWPEMNRNVFFNKFDKNVNLSKMKKHKFCIILI